MKGLIFTSLCDFIENEFGLEYWDYLIHKTQPESKGIYTASKTYHDQEILNYIGTICKEKDIKPTVLLDQFGTFLFPELYKFHQTIMSEFSNFDNFILSVNDIIHVEVNKLWEQTVLPSIITSKVDDTTIIMEYSSQRKLCFLAIGLIKGASEQYKTPVKIEQKQCMHDNHTSCIIEITKIAV